MLDDTLSDLRDKAYREIVEQVREAHTSQLESFDVYMTRKIAEMRERDNAYIKAIRNGYNVILSKLTSKGLL